jgi:predicted small integral membrane protein
MPAVIYVAIFFGALFVLIVASALWEMVNDWWDRRGD